MDIRPSRSDKGHLIDGDIRPIVARCRRQRLIAIEAGDIIGPLLALISKLTGFKLFVILRP
jgi:hypothetical protein